MTKSNESTIAMIELGVIVGRNTEMYLTPYRIATACEELSKIARSLHKRYTNMCSYPWADTDSYAARTEKLEEKARIVAAMLGIEIELQRDPRGWPIIIKAEGHEMRLG